MKPSLCVFLLLSAGLLCSAAPVELLRNTGFEEVDAGRPLHWETNGPTGMLSANDFANHGKKAAKFKLLADNGHIGTNVSTIPADLVRPGIPVVCGATYHATVWARGGGVFQFLVPQQTNSSFAGSLFGPTNDLAREWRRYEYSFKISDPRIKSVALGLMLLGKGSEALFDDISLVFDPADNPGIDPACYAVKTPALKTSLTVKTSAAALKRLWVNGRQADAASFSLKEGLNVIAVEAEATGAAPGLGLCVDSAPWAATAWKLSPAAPDGWLEPLFNDSSWARPVLRGNGLLWGGEEQKQLFFRQVVLWNESHTGPNRCLQPLVRSLSFCPDTMEVMQLALYSPLPFVPQDYTFTLDLPRGFRLMDKLNHGERWIMNVIPDSIESKPLVRGGQPYVRHTMAFSRYRFSLDGTLYSCLPIRLDRELPPGTKLDLFYRRQAGNFVELEQRVPIKVLPPLRGERPRQVRIQMYNPYPTGYSVVSNEVIDQLARQTAAAGVNWAFVSGIGEVWGKDYAEAMARFTRRLQENGVRLAVGATGNFPFYGLYCDHFWFPAAKDALRWLKETPAARARYFNDAPKWGTAPSYYMYCPTYALGEGRERFKAFLRAYYRDLFERVPAASELFLDWESNVWENLGGVAGKGSWCFCDRCRKGFAASLGLDDLSDTEILEKRRGDWEKRRALFEGGISQVAKEVCAESGRQLQVYCQSQELGFIKSSKGAVDTWFIGCPGNGVANGRSQGTLNNLMDTLRPLGIKRVVGQRFPYWLERGKDAWKRAVVMSDDGYMDSRNWKPQIVRVVANCHGGVDLQGSFEFVGGMLYYVGEATRLISAYEDLFHDGELADNLAVSPDIAYPDLLVLRKGGERLVLLFNEDKENTRRVRLRNLELGPGARAQVYGQEGVAADPAAMTVDIPPEDVVAVHVMAVEAR